MDTTEIPGTDNLHSPEGIIKGLKIMLQKPLKAMKHII